MKFETEGIYLVKSRFWFVVWSTMATWRKDFSSLLAKKSNNNNLEYPKHTFFYISLTLFCTTIMWNFMLENVVYAHRFFVVFLFTFFSTLPLIFTLLAAFSHFLTAISMFFRQQNLSLVFLSNASALLLMSLKTLKFSRTWLCFWFLSLLSPDGLSLSKKSGWT